MRLCLIVAIATGPAFFAAPALAEGCPAPAVDEVARDALHEKLRLAPDPGAARMAQNELWQIWTAAPDAAAQEMLDNGMERIRLGDYERAIRVLDGLVAYCPDYAEGYNQRAFAHFLRDAFDPALADLEAALDRSPEHIGALSGKALTLMGLGRDAEALAALEAALKLNPWLNERHLLPTLKDRAGATDL